MEYFTHSRRLITALHEAQKADVIDNLHSILVSPSMSVQPNIQYTTQHEKIVWYSGYLKKRYSQVHIAVMSKKWLPSPTQKIFNLAIIKKERIQRGKIDDDFVCRTIRGQVDDILLKKSPIELEKLFVNIEGERKVILIDGAPGSGKSTLTVHICQRWARGELFQEFTIVILVQLRDTAVQSAKSIADLIPCHDKESVLEVAKAIIEVDGRGILWVLDGWDELPSKLREKSILRDMITPSLQSPIVQSSVIVTSRPISSGDLSELVSSRIEVLGFTWEEQRQYFTECLKGDTKAVDTLMERLSENPAIEGSCYLPLNASIVAHLYLTDGFLPRTVYGIFSALVQHCLSHYLRERLGRTQEEAQLTSLNSLPQILQAPFDQLCELAFRGISQNKVTFSPSDLETVKDSAVICEVGLLQATPSILTDGRTVYFNFIHLSIQEMLSAVYISHMPASEQISTFESLFGDTRFSAVFQFYSAITKLRISRPFLSLLPYWMCPIPACVLDLVRNIILNMFGHPDYLCRVVKPQPLMVSLLHCLYEAQDPFLCQFVAEQMGNWLYLETTSLTPVDCLAIGYFISTVSLTTINAREFKVTLCNCSLGDAGTKSLIRSICRSMDPHNPVNAHLELTLGSNRIHEEGALHIAELLNSTSLVSDLWLGPNPIGDKGLQTIFDALKKNKTLKRLNIYHCGLTDIGVASLADALITNNTLESLFLSKNKIYAEGASHIAELLNSTSIVSTLDLSNNPIGDKGLQTIFDAIKQNKTLKKLDISHCDMTDAGVASLAGALRINNTLETLNFSHNKIHEEGASLIAELLSSTSIDSSTLMLIFNNNPIGDRGLQTIFDVLKQNKTLKYLNVAKCNMTDTGVALLADALHANSTLETLNIEGNIAITENGLSCLVKAVSRHSGLKVLYISYHLEKDNLKLEKTINERRKKNGLPNIYLHLQY